MKKNACLQKSLDDLAHGAKNLPEFKIITTSPKPIYQPSYRKSERERTILNKEVEKMLQAGIIRKASSPWSTPCIIVHKKMSRRDLASILENLTR